MSDSVLVLGVGTPSGVGGSTAVRFAAAGFHVQIAGRTQKKLDATLAAIQARDGDGETMLCDVCSEADLDRVFQRIGERGAPLAAVVYNAGNNAPIPFSELHAADFEAYWRVCCLGGFMVAKRAMPVFTEQRFGSLLFTGASASLRGKPQFAHFSAAKGALRNLAQSLAREYGPQGVHVAHVIVDGIVNGDRAKSAYEDYLDSLGEDGALDPDAIANVFFELHDQPRSAWTHELDLRPFGENW